MIDDFIFTPLKWEERETFDRIVFNGSLGTPATPYDEYVNDTQPYKVGKHNPIKLQQIVDYILADKNASGHILALPSEDSVKSYGLAVYNEGKILVSTLLLEIMQDEPGILLYKMQMQDNTIWIVILDGVDEIMNNGGFSITPSLHGMKH